MRGLILAGGSGTRLKPLTYTQSKQLIPVVNKPIVFYGIEALAKIGIKNIVVIISKETGKEVKEAIGNGSAWGAEIEYVIQDGPFGLAHAVGSASYLLGDSQFVMLLGDNILEDDLLGYKLAFETSGVNTLLLTKEVENPQAFGVVELDKGKIVSLVEKPKEPKSNLALVGVYFFDKNIHTAVRNIKPSARGEYEITDAIRWQLQTGLKVEQLSLKGFWLDTGKKDSLLEANRLVLDKIGTYWANDGSMANCIIKEPVNIAAGCMITNCTIGPHVSIGKDTVLSGCIIKNSIILDNCVIYNQRLCNSAIGNNNYIEYADRTQKEVTLGDGNTIKECTLKESLLQV